MFEFLYISSLYFSALPSHFQQLCTRTLGLVPISVEKNHALTEILSRNADNYKRIKNRKLVEKLVTLDSNAEEIQRKNASKRKQLASMNDRLQLARQLSESFKEHRQTW